MSVRLAIKDLMPSTNYVLRVRAKNGEVLSQWSPVLNFATITDTFLPTTPTGVSWSVVGDGFQATWTTVTQNTNGNIIPITRYEVELVANAITKIVSVSQVTGDTVKFDLSFEQNLAFFGGFPQPAVALRVRAVDNKDLKSAYTSTSNATNPTPTPPTSVVATGGTGTIEIKWVAPATSTDTDIIGYNVYIGATKIWTGNALAFTYQTVIYTSQTFIVKAIDKFNQESTGASASATANSPFIVDTTPPSVPAGLAAVITANANGIGATAAVSWTAVTGHPDLAGYVVRYRRNGTSDNYSEVTVSDDTIATSVPLNAIYTSYDFQVRSFDFVSNFSAWSGVVTASGGSNGTPAVPTALASTPGKDSIVYSWTGVADPDIKNYDFTFSTSSTFASGNITYLTGTSTTLTVSGLSPSTLYYGRVRATDTGGLSSAFTATDTETTLAYTTSTSDGAVPSGSPAAAVTSGIGYLFVSWSAQANNDAVTYEVHISTSNGFTPTAGGATMVAKTSATVIGLEKDAAGTALAYGTTYYVRIFARDVDGPAAAAGTQGSGTIAQAGTVDIAAGSITAASAILASASVGTANIIDLNVTTAKIALLAVDTAQINNLAVTNAKINDLSVAKLTAGTVGNGVGITMAAGSSILLNGGHERSNTYNGSFFVTGGTTPGTNYLATPPANGSTYNGGTVSASTAPTAGFYLGNDGLIIAQGRVKAEAFEGGSFTAGAIAMGAGGSITASGFILSNSGLTVTTGSISAPALLIQDSTNIVSPEYASFESPNPVVTNTGGAMIIAANLNPRYGLRSLGTLWGTLGSNPVLYLGSSTTDYNVPFEAGETYIVSVYTFSAGAVATNVQLKVKFSDASTQTIATVTNASGGSPTSGVTRLQGTVVAPVNNGIIFVESSTLTSAAGYNLDGLQVERKVAGLSTASTWKPPGMTKIDGGIIRTGSILSTATAQVWDTNTNPGTSTAVTITINGTTTVTSSTSGFLSTDVGKLITATGIPAAATITAFANTGSVTISIAATTSSTNITGQIYRSPIGGFKTDPQAAPAWSISTTGSATFGNALVRGALVIGYVDSGGTTITNPNLVDTTKMGYMASATYIPGSEGWIIRSDGSAEFNRVVVGSLNGNAVEKGTLAADRIDSGIMSADLAIAGSFETAQTPTNIIISTNATTTITATTGQFYPEDVGSTITGTNIPAGATIVTYTDSTHVVLSATTTGTGTGLTAVVLRGRKVRISPSGIILYSGGTISVSIPTDPTQTVKFTGTVTTNDLYVGNNFRMFGANNSIGRDTTLNIDSGVYTPQLSPDITFDWETAHLIDLFGGSYAPNLDSYVNTPVGFTYDPTNTKFYYVSEFFGTQIYPVSSTFVVGAAFNMNSAFHNGSNDVAYGGMETDSGSNMYFLTNEKGTDNWRMQAFTKSSLNAGSVAVGDRTADFAVPGITTGGLPSGLPSFGISGSNIYLVKITSGGALTIIKYTSTANVASNTIAYNTSFSGYGTPSSIVSCRVGQFDMGGNTYLILTVILGGASEPGSGFTYQLVFQDTGSTFVDTGLHFPVAQNKGSIGITWVGTSNNDTGGYFRTLATDGYTYKYTSLGKVNTNTTIKAQQRWRGDGTGGSTLGLYPLGPMSANIASTRRARLTVTSREMVPNTAPGPNSVTFYIGVGAGTAWRYPAESGSETAAGVNFIRVLTDFRTSDISGGGFTTTNLSGTGLPGKIISSVGLSISGDGHATFPGTGWINLTMNSINNVGFGWYNCQAKRVGNTIYLRGLGTNPSATAAGQVIATIPTTVFGGTLGGITQLAQDILGATGAPVAGFRFDVQQDRQITTLTAYGANAFVGFDNVTIDIT